MAVMAWCHRGIWPRLRAYLQAKPDLSGARLDSTIGRAHVSAAGAPQKKEADPARGRSRGGFGTPIPILADRRGRALGEDWTDAPLPCPIADRAYDRDGFRAWRAQRDIKAVIPARRERLNPQPHDPEQYEARNAVERGIDGLKPWCRVATTCHVFRALLSKGRS